MGFLFSDNVVGLLILRSHVEQTEESAQQASSRTLDEGCGTAVRSIPPVRRT